MLRIFAVSLATGLALLLPGCGGGTLSIDVKQVLIRTLDSFEKFDEYMKQYEYTAMTPELFAQFKIWLDNELNRSPTLHAGRITTRINADASIAGFADSNANGKVDAAEPRLFKIEIDIDNRRLIATAEGGSSYGYHPRPGGFIGGYLVSNLAGQQRQAGIRYGHFSNRTVHSSGITRPDPTKTAAHATSSRRTYRSSSGTRPYSSARSRTRSGGLAGGK